MNDPRFDTPLYTVTQAARLVGLSPSTLVTWAKGYERRRPSKATVAQGPVITAIDAAPGMPSIPFIGLVESTVVEAFRRSGLPMQRIRKALEVLADQGVLDHALASKQLYTDGAEILFDYAGRAGDKQLRLLTVVRSKQIVFHDVIAAYLERISFGDTWATELIVPVTENPILRVRPNVAGGDPLFMHGGAPLSAVHDRLHRRGVDSIDCPRLRRASRRHHRGSPCRLADQVGSLSAPRSSSCSTASSDATTLPRCSHGHVVHVMADVYPDGADQALDDPAWMDDIDRRRWVLLTKDASIVRVHRDELASSSLQIFSLDSSKLTGTQMAARCEQHLNRMMQRCKKPGPFFDVLHAANIERRYP